MQVYHLYLVIAALAAALVSAGFVLYRVAKHLTPKHSAYPDCREVLGQDWEMRQQASRAMIEILCDAALELIAKRIRERADVKDPVEIATTMVDVSIRTGNYDVLNSALAKVEPTWPKEIVVTFWNETARVQDKLPARDVMWDRFRAQYKG